MQQGNELADRCSFNYLGRLIEDLGRDRQAELLGRLQVRGQALANPLAVDTEVCPVDLATLPHSFW